MLNQQKSTARTGDAFLLGVVFTLALGQQHTTAKVLVPEFIASGALGLAATGAAVELEAFGAGVDGVGHAASVALEGHACGAAHGGCDTLAVLKAGVAWALLNDWRHAAVLSKDVAAFAGGATAHDTLIVVQAGAGRARLDQSRRAPLVGFERVSCGAVLIDVGSTASVGHHTCACGAAIIDVGHAAATLLEGESRGAVGAVSLCDTASIFER